MNDRADAIGGSDVAAIMGISPWRTAWDVWAEKTRDLLWQPPEQNPMMHWGNLLEPIVLAEYERVTGRTVTDRQAEIVHPKHPYLRVHLDGRAGEGIVEAKTAHDAKHWGTVEEPVVPEHYLAQVYDQLALSGAPWCDVAVLLPRGDFRIIRIEADEKVQRGIVAACVAFWEGNVVPRIPPPMDASPAATRWLARMPDDDEDALEAGAELEDIIERLANVRDAAKAFESTEALLLNQARALVGEHQKAVGRGWHVTYKRNRPFPVIKYKEAALEMRVMMQLGGMAEQAEAIIDQNTTIEENRRPFILKREAE